MQTVLVSHCARQLSNLPPPGKKFSNNEGKARPMIKTDLNDPIAALLETFQILECS